jgi:DUF1680 family protein
VNGQPIETEKLASVYAPVRRNWKAEDKVTIEFEMPAQLIESHPLVEETRNHVAVRRGPVVYCLESPDLPSHVRVRQVALRANTNFHPVDGVEGLGGVICLEANVVHHPEDNWASSLYRPVRQRDQRTITTRFIPYFAWAKRGESEMSVWIPRVD